MLSTVLHLNDQNNALFEFVVDMCYKQPSEFAKRYFKSLVMLFSKRFKKFVKPFFTKIFLGNIHVN